MKPVRVAPLPDQAQLPGVRLVRAEESDLPVELWTVEEAARALKVGVTYLLASDCPRIRLPSNSPNAKKQAVRFDPILTMQWTRKGRTDTP